MVPAMARTAAHVTMLQRSPTYVVARPEQDALANFLRRHLPLNLAFTLVRWRNVLCGICFFGLCKRNPEVVKQWILDQAGLMPGADYDVNNHFTPRYNPWDQRMCLAPDGDFFRAVKHGKADIVTDQIDTFTETGIRLQSGRELAADIIVTATGLKLQMLGGIGLTVDGKPVKFGETMNFRGTLLSDVPNFANVFGYTNASWTLKSDLVSAYVARLINYMDRHGYDQCTPRRRDPSAIPEPFLDLSSGYIKRAQDLLPRQGSKKPWRLYQNYVLDLISLRYGPVSDSALEFSRRRQAKQAA